MKLRYTSIALAAVLSAGIAHANPTLVDSFESANLSAPTGPAPAVNTNGFTWGGTNYTSVVTMINGIGTSVFNGVPTNRQFPGMDYTCYESAHCLRFHYPAWDSMAEQRFDLGTQYRDAWVRYWIRVPPNFYHGDGNNKFAAFWTNVYDGPGDVTWQTRPTSDGSAKLVVQDGGVAVPEADTDGTFIRVPDDRNRWMQVVIRMKPATTPTSNDGILQFYRRWSNETTFTTMYNKTNASFHEAGRGVSAGYLMGWANAPYSENTEWLVDGFTVSNTSLLDVETGSEAVIAPPSPPSLTIRLQ